jgi:hypothetical protein
VNQHSLHFYIFAKEYNIALKMDMNTKKLPVIFAILLFAIACHTPKQKSINNEEFQAIIETGKNYATVYPDSTLMLLREILLQPQINNDISKRGQILNVISLAYDTKGMYDSVAHCLYEAIR